MGHQKNPGYTELSQRSILEWAEKSGIRRQNGFQVRTSNDEPGMNLSIQSVENGKLSQTMRSFAAMQGRHYVVMQVKNNLIKEEREKLLAAFPGDLFKKVAHVQLGEPAAD